MNNMQCPKGERALVGYYNRNGERVFLLTSKQKNDGLFYMYEDQPDGTLKKLGKAKSPPELEYKYEVSRKMFA